ncbi:MAG: GAF domain-containing protein [Anaerolineae bacterium]|nr:GAF domain-containing protein [Anaerolineae bacterium]
MADEPFLKAVNLSKRYGGIEALRHIDLDILPGQVIGLVGDTDSGKSTLMHLLAGVLYPDSGHFFIEGRRAHLSPPHRAAYYGIQVVQQETHFAEHMTGLGYIFSGRAPYRFAPLRWIGWWDRREMYERAYAEFERLDFEPPPLECPLHDLTSTQRKMVEIVSASIWSPRLLLLDEPLNALETYKANILSLIENVRARGGSVLLVTQNLDDIFRVASRIIVLNAGRKVAERDTKETTEEEIVRLILVSVENRLTPAVWALRNYFEVRRQADELDRLNKTLERRANQLQAHAEVARSATSILDRDQLLNQIVQIIQQRFDYYYTGIFLVDDQREFVVLQSSASQDRHHIHSDPAALPIDTGSMIGWCASTGQSRLTNDVSQDALFKPNSLLPDARSELVLPLRIGKRVLGVLDLQSDRLNAFDAEDVFALQGLSDQLAIAIRNADLFEAARMARQQADEANRYKSIFLSNMSHELRTPLSAIIGHTQAMLSPKGEFYPVPIPDDYRRDLSTIRKSGEHLLALINDILDLSKIEAGELKLNQGVIDLKNILDEVFHTTKGLVQGRPIDLRRDYGDEPLFAWADNMRTRQIMLNLLSNAAKYTERGSIILRAIARPGQITVSVSDTGVGIPQHLQQNIFDRFRQGDATTARKYGGTGLGLSISQQLVELQGGRIWVESDVGAGSVFSFTLPAATSEQLAQTAAQPVESPLPNVQRAVIFQPDPQIAQARLVLLAQEDTLASFVLQQALKATGFVVELTAVDELVLEMVEVMQPDLIILDSTLPNGMTILYQLLQTPSSQQPPIIAFVDDEPAEHAAFTAVRKAEATPRRVVQMACAFFSEQI